MVMFSVSVKAFLPPYEAPMWIEFETNTDCPNLQFSLPIFQFFLSYTAFTPKVKLS